MSFKIIDAKSLNGLLESGEIRLVDVRDAAAYEKEHIPGAISVPLMGFPDTAIKALDKGERIVVYCTNLQCSASPTAAGKLVEMGYMDVTDFEVGLAGWKEAGLQTHCPSCVGVV